MEQTNPIERKILTHDQLIEIRREIATNGLMLVQCHGCFDIVHPGHIRHLKFAAAQGDRLLVSITGDEYVNKGPDRPMFSHDLRAENLAALEFVDWVYIHHEPTASKLLGELKPEIYIKGAEYASKSDQRFDDERAIVESYNGRVVFSSSDVVYSSSAIVETIQKTSRPDPQIARLSQLASAYDLSTAGISRTLQDAAGKRILVLGETILDTYTSCQWPEIAEEHPMLSLRALASEQFDGGAAIVAQHLAALGTRPILCTPVPTQYDARGFLRRMDDAGIEVVAIDVDGEMPEKKRFLVGRDKVMKLECANEYRIDHAQQMKLIERMDSIEGLDGVILADFGLGLFSDGLTAMLCSALAERDVLVAGDVSSGHTSLCEMMGADVVCPCESELRHAMHDHKSPIVDVAQSLRSMIGARALVVTLGSEGVLIVTQAHRPVHIPALSVDPIDPLGCGDALLASMVVSMLGGAGFAQSSYIGSLAAAVAGGVIGNLPVGSAQIIEHAQSLGAQLAHSSAQSQQAIGEFQAAHRGI